MKLKYILIGIAIIIIAVFTTLIIIKINKKSKPINGLTHLHLSYSTGYHKYAYTIYDLDYKDGKYIVNIKPTDIPDEDAKEYEISEETVKQIEKKLMEYDVTKWDGFKKSNQYVLDGDSFSFNMKYEEDKSINASGYMMWPDNYREVKSYLDEVLGSLYK